MFQPASTFAVVFIAESGDKARLSPLTLITGLGSIAIACWALVEHFRS